MKQGMKKVLSIVLMLVMVLGAMLPHVTEEAFAGEGTIVTYEGESMGDQWVVDANGNRSQVYCVNHGREYKASREAAPGPQRVQYEWNEDPTRHKNEIANFNIGNALAVALLANQYDSNGNVKPTGGYGGIGDNEFVANDVVASSACADLLKKVLCVGQKYQKEGKASGDDIQSAVYWVIYNGKNGNTSGGNFIVDEALKLNQVPEGTLYVYVLLPDAYRADRTGWPQCLVGGTFVVEEEVKVWLHGRKELVGEGAPAIQDEQFTFKMVNADDENEVYTRYNYGNDIWFPELSFKAPGTYTYNITEVKGEDPSITYDETVKTLVIEVTKDESGKLIASVDGVQIATSDDKKEDGSLKAGEIDGNVDKYKFVNKIGEQPEEPPVEEKKGELSTTVEVNGSKGSETAEAEVKVPAGEKSIAVDVKDTIDYKNLVKGNTYKVQGTLMEVAEDGTTTEVAKSDAEEKVAEEENGTWEIVFKNVTLEVGKKYVVFESATPIKDAENNEITDGKVIEHNDPKDKAQTVVVTEEEPTEPEEPKEEEPEKPTEPEEPKEEEPEKPTEPEEPKENEPPTEEPEEPKENTPPPQVPSTGQKEPPKNETPTTPQNPPQAPPQVPSTGNPPAAPNTGDTNNIMLWVLLGAAAAFVATLSLRIRIKR